MQFNFAGQRQAAEGHVLKTRSWQAARKAAMVLLIFWGFGLMFLFAPYVGISLWMIFLLMSPLLALVVFFQARRVMASVVADTHCPACGAPVHVSASNVMPPLYGSCPGCKLSYELVLPER